jgi:D-alanyl-D-alanine carboxypeptidase (penicillin-binding protein 5/6)
MNDKAVELELSNSHFAVAHGMHNDENYSTAHDISILSNHAMKNQFFRSIVKHSTHTCASTMYPEHIYNWENTN